MTSHIIGDASRQAVDCLGGYAYQIYAAALAWVTLSEGEVLHLEIAEDFAVSTKDALRAVQVRKTATAVTSNSKGIVEAIDAFVRLTVSNSHHRVTFRYLTTSLAGLERDQRDRVSGEGFLQAWANLRQSGELGALRARLEAMGLSSETLGYLGGLDDEAFRACVLQRIWFDCGSASFDALRGQLDDVLVEYGVGLNLFAADSEKARPAVIERVLNVSCERGGRILRKADFARLFERQNTAVVPAALLRTALQVSLQHVEGVSLAPPGNLLEPLAIIPEFAGQAPRVELRTRLQEIFDEAGVLWLHAGTGYGKTLLARIILTRNGKSASILRLRDMSADQVVVALERARVQQLLDAPGSLLIDDMASFEFGRVAEAFQALVSLVRERGGRVIVTSYLMPAERTLDVLGVRSGACCEVGVLTAADIGHMVRGAPGRHDNWLRYVQLGSANGHPQLAHALTEGLVKRGWPEADLDSLPALFGSDQSIGMTREEVRRRLIHELSVSARMLTYRLSLVTSGFTREMALAVAAVDEALPLAGELLDGLVGPWVERAEDGHFELSPLLREAGFQQLSQDEQVRVHGAVAASLTEKHTIDSRHMDQLLISGIAGKAESALAAFAVATISSPVAQLQLLAKQCTTLTVLSTEAPIYVSNARIAVQLRAIQIIFSVVDERATRFHAALRAFDRELALLEDQTAAGMLRTILWSKLFALPQLVEIFPEFASYAIAVEDAAQVAGLSTDHQFGGDGSADGYQPTTMPMAQAFLVIQLSFVCKLEKLETVMEAIARLSPEERARVLPPRDSVRFNPEQMVKSTWVRARRGSGYDSRAFADRCIAAAGRFKAVDARDFAIGSFATAAVILSEELTAHEEALELLDRGRSELGDDYVLARCRAGILSTLGRYREQLDEIEPFLGSILAEGWIERAYLYREIAIAHGHLGDWKKAYSCFVQARSFALRSQSEKLGLMAIGLAADAGVALWFGGDHVEALRTVNGALKDAAEVDADVGFNQRAVRRLVAFAGFWMYAQDKDLKAKMPEIDAQMVIGCCSNPNPHEDLEKMVPPPIVGIRYMLAQVDIAYGSKAGIWKDEISQLTASEALLMHECTLHASAFDSAIERGSPEEIASFGPTSIDAKYAMDQMTSAGLDFEGQPHGKLEKAPRSAWLALSPAQINQIAFFMLAAIDDGRADRIDTFVAATSSSERGMLSDDEIASLRQGDVSQIDANCSLFGSIGRLRHAFETGIRPILPELFILSLRLIETFAAATQTKGVMESISLRLLMWWDEASQQESYRLSSPRLARPEIAAAIPGPERSAVRVANLVLVAAPYLEFRISKTYLTGLRDQLAGLYAAE